MDEFIYESFFLNDSLRPEQTFVKEYVYDTWGRMMSMTYPGGEQVQYHYDCNIEFSAHI